MTDSSTPAETAASSEMDAFSAELLSRITGTRLAVGGHRPFLIEETSKVWLILKGHIDVYAIEMDGNAPANTGRHVMRVGPGAVLFGVDSLPLTSDSAGDRLALRAVAAMGTELYEGAAADVQGDDFDIVVVDWIDQWVSLLSRAMTSDTIPRSSLVLEAEPEQRFDTATDACAQFEDVVWVTVDAGSARLLDHPGGALEPGGLALPITDQTWVSIDADSTITCSYTPTVLFLGDVWGSVSRFHGLLMPMLRDQIMTHRREEAARKTARVTDSDGRFTEALHVLGSVLDPDLAAQQSAPTAATDLTGALFSTFAMVAQSQGVTALRPKHGLDRHGVDPLREFARATGMRMRRVRLDDQWWTSDTGPLLAYLEGGEHPVALMPRGGGSGGYDIVDAVSGARTKVNRASGETLDYLAFIFYRPFPAKALSVREVLAFGLAGLRRELWLVLGLGLLSGLLGMVVPITIGYLFSDVVPRADLNTFFAVIGALVLTAFGVFVFDVTRGFTVLRITGKMDGRIQSAVWDRLLALPLSFFRDYNSGDLADRANSINSIREVLTGATLQSVFSAIFSLFSFALLFYYSWELALVATGLILIVILTTTLFTWMMIPHKQAMLEVLGKVEGQVFQYLAGIAKLRSSNSEARAFARWADLYTKSKYHGLAAARLNAGQAVFNAMFPIVAAITVFAYVFYQINDPMSEGPSFTIGQFLSFNAALGQFNASVMAFAASASQIVEIVPLYRRADPILKAVPEMTANAVDPGELSGMIELSNATFRYAPEALPVLNNLSFTIRAGEFVAFVGSSGSGKSTILRLLLGFEQAESGGVYYDGQDLTGLNLGAVRRQIGVVLQGSRLTSGTIFESIVGSSKLTQKDAWEAARAAGLGEDIDAMPMGMHTVVSEGASTFSGGQKQRLMIARAMAQKPRILILDEATSALDNRTQAIVNASLDRQNLTRIVVAHRLTTIVNADRIIMLQGGQIVEQGKYAELLARDGPFAAMAKRQLL
ncbi:MAG: ATP-binding cassette subfamily C protein [Paracoccaceae bacterium]|jgi:ATP-binding cassette subfamily C protein